MSDSHDSKGQKTSVESTPVVIASDQTAVQVTGTVTASNPSVGTVGSAVPTSATEIAGSDGTNLRVPAVLNAAPSGSEYAMVTRVIGGGGGGVAQTQVRSGANVWTDVGYAGGDLNMPVQGTVTATQATGTNLHVVVDTAPTTAITAASLPLPTGAAQDATLTGGTAKAIVRGGAKGATSAADVTSTATDANHQALDVNVNAGTIAGSTTPADAFANPTNAVPAFALLAGWNDNTSQWDRIKSEGVAADGDNTPSAGVLAVENYGVLYNGTTWDRARGTAANGAAVDVTRVAAGTNRVGGVYDVGGTVIDEVPTARAVSRAFVNATASGNTAVVAAQGVGVRIRVLAVFLMSATALTVKFQSAAGDITAGYPVAATGGFVMPETQHGWFQTNADEALNINLSGAGTVGANIIWVQAT